MRSILDGDQPDPQSDRDDDPNAPYRGGIFGPLGPSTWGGSLALPAQPPTGFPAVPGREAPSPGSAQGATPPQAAAIGFGRDPGAQNSLMSLLSGVGGAVGGLFGGGAPWASPAPAMSQPFGSPGLLDRLTAGTTNLTTGGNPIAGLLNAVNGLATGQRTDRAGIALARQQGMTQALMNMGVNADMARLAAINPDVLRALVAARYGSGSATQPTAPVPRTGADRSAPALPSRPQPIGVSAGQPPQSPAPNAGSRVDSTRPLLRVATPTEAARLPSGTHFVDSLGKERVVP
jgi:hypothetical protein